MLYVIQEHIPSLVRSVPWLCMTTCISLQCLLLLIIFIITLLTYCVSLPQGGPCVCKRAPWTDYPYQMFTSYFVAIVSLGFTLHRNRGIPAEYLF